MLEALGSAASLLKVVVALVAVYGMAVTIFLVASGVGPVLWRLGNGLARRRIAVFARGAEQNSLQNMLVKSKLFKASKIEPISSKSDLKQADTVDVQLVYWPEWRDEIKGIIERKKEATALIIFAPQSGKEEERIPPDVMKMLGNERNVVLSNMRGRLMNDIVLSMITSGYETR